MAKTNRVANEDEVRAIAHSVWIEEGRPEGQAENHWFKALERLNAEARSELEAEAALPPNPKRKAPAAVAAAKKPAARKISKS